MFILPVHLIHAEEYDEMTVNGGDSAVDIVMTDGSETMFLFGVSNISFNLSEMNKKFTILLL